MALVAVLYADEGGGSDLTVGGISMLERQIRLVHRVKVDRVLVLGGGGPDACASSAAAAAAIADDDMVLMLAPGLVIDERIIDMIATQPVTTIACWPGDAAETSHPERKGLERIDASWLSAGVALYRGQTLIKVAASLGDWDLASTVLRASLAEPDVQLIDLAKFELYAPARRRAVPLTWARPQSLADARVATETVIAAAQKGCLDWPAAFIHPPIEDGLVRILAPTPITPNMVTLFVFVLGIGAGVAFATGWLWTGLVLALVSGPLDGVDGKLARTRVEFSRFGDLEHVLDKVTEYGWYLCLAGHFANQSAASGAWAVAMLIILFALAESLQGEFYRRFTGAQLDDAGGFERRFRIISGRRNTFFWTYLPFAAAGAWYAGFQMIAIYSVITYFTMQTRLFVRLQGYGSAQSPRIAANFTRTAYAFLPAAKRSAS